MSEDPIITLWKIQLGEIAEQLTSKEQELERVEKQLYVLQQKRDNLNREIYMLRDQVESIENYIIYDLGS
ncbi:MAG: hypothetical protein QNJ63_26055 [Calothrix sp. MO_192.B10]|nr:hypothetical protein [Calothrix sp. MO_192.B10]